MVGYRERGYILTAPHVSVKVGGKEVSGTVMRQLLGSPDYEKKSSYNLHIQTTDQNGLTFSQAFTLLVNDLVNNCSAENLIKFFKLFLMIRNLLEENF